MKQVQETIHMLDSLQDEKKDLIGFLPKICGRRFPRSSTLERSSTRSRKWKRRFVKNWRA
jgi:hypothetical protein